MKLERHLNGGLVQIKTEPICNDIVKYEIPFENSIQVKTEPIKNEDLDDYMQIKTDPIKKEGAGEEFFFEMKSVWLESHRVLMNNSPSKN